MALHHHTPAERKKIKQKEYAGNTHKTPDWVKRAGRRPLTKQEAEKVEARRVDVHMARRRRKPKPKPKPKPELPWYKKYNPFDILARGPLAPKKEKE